MISLKIEKTRKIFLATILTVNLWSISLDGAAFSRMAYAVVTSADGIPCFSITEKEEKRNGVPTLKALIVSDLSVRPIKKIWSFHIPSETHLPLHANACIQYGELPISAISSTNSESLIPGHFYRVFLNGSPKDPSDPTYGYQGKFCIAIKPDGGQQVISIQSTTRAWIDEVCPTAP